MESTGVTGLATALSNILTVDNFMSSLTALVGVIGGVLIFAFIFRRVKRIISGAQNGKAKI